MKRHLVATVNEIPPGKRKVVRIDDAEIGIFNVAGQFKAVLNVCPHHGAPLCRGSLHGTNMPSEPGEFRYERKGQILRCPWHGWEFDLTKGCGVAEPEIRCRMYEVTVENDNVILVA